MSIPFAFSLLLSAACNNKSSIDVASSSGTLSRVWVADNGDGTYKNPILHADYSDPDAIRVGDDFYMTASSFTCVPGLPVLHSRDLVNWEIIGHALKYQIPRTVFDKPQQGNGVWAPCIRYHQGEYYIYYPDPDHGIYLVKAKNPAGPWSDPVMVKSGKGLIDPSPLWDDDGDAYLVHAFAGSRAGIKSILVVCRMNDKGTKVLDDGVLVFDGHEKHPTIEGPKFYKRNRYYYIFAPGGGVKYGWQVVLRSKHIYGPYEDRVVLAQGKSPVNGPHQGAWVELKNGESWFLHFQDIGPYGRVVHLQPMQWKDDWPVIGVDEVGDGTGEPVLLYKKPRISRSWPVTTPRESDEFSEASLGLQWQWNANPQPYWAVPFPEKGFLRLYSVPLPKTFRNFYFDLPNALLQKFPAPAFTVTASIAFNPRNEGETGGLIVMGRDYAYLGINMSADSLRINQTVCRNADKEAAETLIAEKCFVPDSTIYLRVSVRDSAVCEFSYSVDSIHFEVVGGPFRAREGGWIGAKVGLFMVREGKTNDAGCMDVDWFRIERRDK
ncbi:MAG: glycoside hydrolase 43 family protein [Bacteroidales bacterium]|nr:glycoside hydrolase 43 family protein [Bacteroidales bacterium]